MAVIDIANRSGEANSPSQTKLLAVANQRWPELMRSDERPTQRDLEQAKCLGAHADESLVPAVLGTFVLMAIMVVGLAGISYMIFHPPGSRTQVASVDPASEQGTVTTRTEAKSTHSKSRSNDAADRNVAGISSRHQGLANQQAQPKTKRPEHRPTRIPFHEEYQNRSERIEQSRREFELNKAEHLKAMKDSARRSEPGLAVRSSKQMLGEKQKGFGKLKTKIKIKFANMNSPVNLPRSNCGRYRAQSKRRVKRRANHQQAFLMTVIDSFLGEYTFCHI